MENQSDKFCPLCDRHYQNAIEECIVDGSPLCHVTSERLLIGQVLDDRYELKSVVGRGGMGTVYRARQRKLKRDLAIKILPHEYADDVMVVKRFLREARIVSQLAHPNVVTMFDYGQAEDGLLYMVMELLRGRPLNDELHKKGPFEVERAIKIIGQVCDALTEAHNQGIIHRDLKPANIFLVDTRSRRDHVKILDFGISKALLDLNQTVLTMTGIVVGTPAYMSPEQAADQEVTTASDVYCLGILMYEMLSGKLPFEGETPMSLMLKHIHENAPSLREVSGLKNIPPLLDALLLKSMAKEPSQRPQTAQAFSEELDKIWQNFQRRRRPALYTQPTWDPIDGLPYETSPSATTLKQKAPERAVEKNGLSGTKPFISLDRNRQGADGTEADYTASLGTIAGILRTNYDLFLNRLVARVLENVPRYTLGESTVVDEGAELLFIDLLKLLDDRSNRDFFNHLLVRFQNRVQKGYSASEYLLTLLNSIPEMRRLIRECGPENTPALAYDYAELEALLYNILASITDAYLKDITRRLESKNRELNRLNQQLLSQERALTLEVEQASKALESANEFNRRIIDSLNAGLMVVDAKTLKVTFYSNRMEAILATPAEEVLGRQLTEAFEHARGIDINKAVETVRSQGQLPMTKVHLQMPGGNKRSVYIRAHRMYDLNGEPEGTVVMLDDVTERELLIESFSRYVSRDLVQRLLTKGDQLAEHTEPRLCTILFVNITKVTSLTEKLLPLELHQLLSAYFREVIEAVTTHSGIVEKFVGAKVMATFCSSTDPADNAKAALAAAQTIEGNLLKLNQGLAFLSNRPIGVSIGINTGEVILGNLGTHERMTFTVIGDAVHLAEQLQGLAREGKVLMGGQTESLVRNEFNILNLGEQLLEDRNQPLTIFELKNNQ